MPAEPAEPARPARTVPVDALKYADSPRLAGESVPHIRRLARVDDELPPILVHRPSMRVIDGMHRLRAAVLRGDTTVEVEFFDGGEDEAFILAVETNITHGLPLSHADRQAAAERIMALRPDWSDRAIAASAGLSAGTVGAIRRRSTVDSARSNTRVGRDGRTRPLDSSTGRRRAGELISARPDAPLREVARHAGIALATAHDVRERIRRGEDPVPPGRRSRSGLATVPAAGSADPRGTLHALRKDPALRFTDAGRQLLRRLDALVPTPDDRDRLSEQVPPHSTAVVAELARGCAEAWRELAEELDRRGRQDAD